MTKNTLTAETRTAAEYTADPTVGDFIEVELENMAGRAWWAAGGMVTSVERAETFGGFVEFAMTVQLPGDANETEVRYQRTEFRLA